MRTLAAIAVALALAPPVARAGPGIDGDALLRLVQEQRLLDAPGEAVQALRRTGDAAAELVMAALEQIGVPYRRGGNSADEGFDCSGFTRHVFGSALGQALPRRADEQARDAALTAVPRSELRPGDLVFFNTLRRAFSHVGIYLGDGKFIHAPSSGGLVRVEDMRHAYWVRRFNGARRLSGEDGVGVPPIPR
jgi:cell wall-associated NlpC family hydrolase